VGSSHSILKHLLHECTYSSEQLDCFALLGSHILNFFYFLNFEDRSCNILDVCVYASSSPKRHNSVSFLEWPQVT
jgi:hypothetical protein